MNGGCCRWSIWWGGRTDVKCKVRQRDDGDQVQLRRLRIATAAGEGQEEEKEDEDGAQGANDEEDKDGEGGKGEDEEEGDKKGGKEEDGVAEEDGEAKETRDPFIELESGGKPVHARCPIGPAPNPARHTSRLRLLPNFCRFKPSYNISSYLTPRRSSRYSPSSRKGKRTKSWAATLGAKRPRQVIVRRYSVLQLIIDRKETSRCRETTTTTTFSQECAPRKYRTPPGTNHT